MMRQKKHLFLFLSVLALSCVQAQTLSVHSIAAARNGNGLGAGYTLNGNWMTTGARVKLLNPSNFGAAGTYSKTVNIVDTYSAMGNLSQVYSLSYNTIFFFGAFDKLDQGTQTFMPWEIDSIYNWSKRGGKMIICSGQVNPTPGGAPSYDSRVLDTKWGISWAFETPAYFIPTPLGNTTDIFNGPFGNVSSAYQGGSVQGYFDTTNTNVKVLAATLNGKPTLLMDCNTLDLIIADVDGYTSIGNVTSNASILNDQDRFWANSITFMDRLQPLPVVTNSNNLLALNVPYVNYQWYYNSQPISGATNPTYSLTQTGVYYAEVTFNGGCKMKTDSLRVTSITPVEAVSVNEHDQSVLAPSIYPNPFGAFTQVDFKQQVNDVTIRITDEAGREVRMQKFSGKVLKIEKENLAKGIYLITAHRWDKLLLKEKIIIH